MFKLKCMPGQNMTPEEMERQCQLVSNIAVAMESAQINETNENDFDVLVNTQTLEVRVQSKH